MSTLVCPVCNPDGPRKPRVERLSVSVPASLAEWARRRAAARGVSISRVVEDALRHDRHARSAP